MALQALYIDPDLSGRLRFKQLACGPQALTNVFTTNTLLEGLQRLEAKKTYDIVYLASQFSLEIVRQFIATAKRSVSGSKAVFVAILDRASCDMTTIAEYTFAGVDGFLVAPFSVNALTENISISTKILAVRERRNQEVSIEVLAKAAVSNFSLYAKSAKEKKNPHAAREKLRRTYLLARRLPHDLETRFMDSLIDQLTQTSHSPNAHSKSHQGGFTPSRRVVR